MFNIILNQHAYGCDLDCHCNYGLDSMFFWNFVVLHPHNIVILHFLMYVQTLHLVFEFLRLHSSMRYNMKYLIAYSWTAEVYTFIKVLKLKTWNQHYWFFLNMHMKLSTPEFVISIMISIYLPTKITQVEHLIIATEYPVSNQDILQILNDIKLTLTFRKVHLD